MSGPSSLEPMMSDGALVDLYPALRRFAAIVGPDEIEPDDLVHDALVATLTRTSWEDLENPEAYLRTVILNLASNHRRRLGRSNHAFQRLKRLFDGDRRDSYPSDIDELSRLSPKARAVVYLHHIEGQSYAAIGELLGLSEAHARVIGSRSLARLRKLIKEENEFHR